MKIPNKFNGYSRDGVRLYHDPVSAGLMASGTAALGGAGTLAAASAGTAALGTGIAAGVGLASGLPGILGGMGALGGAGTAGSVLGGTALTPAVASLAPAATAQAMGPTLLQASLPGIQGGMGALAPGASGATSGLASTLPGMQGGMGALAPGANPSLAQQIAQHQTVVDATRQNLLAQSGGKDIMGAATQRAPSYNLSTGLKTGLDPRFAGQQSLQAATGPTVDPTAVMGKPISPNQNWMQNLGSLIQNPSWESTKEYAAQHPYATSAAVGLGTKGLMSAMQQNKVKEPESNAMIRPYEFDYGATGAEYQPGDSTSEQLYFNPTYTAGEPYKAAEGGIASAYAMGGPVEQMAAMNAVGANTGFPMANLQTPMYSNPAVQNPEATNVIAPSADVGVGTYSGEQRFAKGGRPSSAAPGGGPAFMGPIGSGYIGAGTYNENARLTPSGSSTSAALPKYSFDPQTLQFTQLGSETKVSGGIATPRMQSAAAPQSFVPNINIPAYQTPEQQLGLDPFYAFMGQQLAGYGGYARGGNVGGEANLGDYSDGGRLLKGPGDGVSDSIPAVIGKRQPARLADGEFVVPARIVSELGNGSTEAGARKLYAMMDRIQKGRRKSVGKGKVAINSKADKHLPA